MRTFTCSHSLSTCNFTHMLCFPSDIYHLLAQSLSTCVCTGNPHLFPETPVSLPLLDNSYQHIQNIEYVSYLKMKQKNSPNPLLPLPSAAPFRYSLYSKFLRKLLHTISDFCPSILFSKFLNILFIYSQREGERDGEKHQCVRETLIRIASCTRPTQGPNRQPRHVPWPGIEPATFYFAGWCSTNWPMSVRGSFHSFLNPLHHSTKTVFVKVTNDFHIAKKNVQFPLLILHDLSTTFINIVLHSLL